MSGVRLAQRVIQAGGGAAAGVAIDRMTQKPSNAPPPSTPPLCTGNEALRRFTERAREASESSDPVRQGAINQIQKRIDLASKVGKLANDPQQAAGNASHASEKFFDEVKVLHGIAVIAQEGPLTAADGARLASAAVESGGHTILNVARGTFAAVTTSPSAVQALGEAMKERLTHDAAEIGTGLAVSQATAAAVSLLPHPGFKVAAAAMRTTGQMAAGAHASEVMRTRTADVPGPVRREIAAIAMEKSAQAMSKPSDEGVAGA